MGMAASQARYLGLTARKTNVEYEGQQVNQARMALAKECANTFSELIALEVPTAPSTQDYTTLQYSYEDGTNTETISNMTELQNDPNYNYMVTHYHFAEIYKGVKSLKSNPQVTFGDKSAKETVSMNSVTYDETTDTYSVDGRALSKYDSSVQEQKDVYSQIVKDYPDFVKTDVSEVYTYTNSDGKICFTTKSDLKKAVDGSADLPQYKLVEDVPDYVGNSAVLPYDSTDSTQKTALEQIRKDFPSESIAETDQIYTWTFQGKTYFATLEDLRTTAQSAPDPTKPTENQNKLNQYDAEGVKTKVEVTEKAFVDLDNSGRPQSIKYEDSSIVYSLNTETITDEAAYNDAMNQYQYAMANYEKRIRDINAKTEKIQEEDRTLELRLRQLDTEQEALQTELEAVKKVIDKNIESTFKTFES